MPIEVEEPAAPSRVPASRLWVQFRDGEIRGPVYGPYREVTTDTFGIEAQDARGVEIVATRLDIVDEVGEPSTVFVPNDDLEHPGERWRDCSVTSTKPKKVSCPQCVLRASQRWNPSGEIRNGSAYRQLSAWATVFGLRLCPDDRVGAEIFAPLEARRSRPEVQREIERLGPLRVFDASEIISAVSSDRSAVYVTVLRLATKARPALLDEVPDGTRIAIVRLGGLLSPSAAGIALTRKRRGTLADPEIVFGASRSDAGGVVIGAIGGGTAIVVTADELRELELLGEVLTRDVSRDTYSAVEDLLPRFGPGIVERLDTAFEEEPTLRRLRPTDVVDVDDLPSLQHITAELLDDYGLGDLLDRGFSAVDGEVATLSKERLDQVTDAFDAAEVAWVRSDARLTAVTTAIGAG